MPGSSVECAPVLTSRPSSRLSRTYLWNVRRQCLGAPTDCGTCTLVSWSSFGWCLDFLSLVILKRNMLGKYCELICSWSKISTLKYNFLGKVWSRGNRFGLDVRRPRSGLVGWMSGICAALGSLALPERLARVRSHADLAWPDVSLPSKGKGS